MKPKTLVASSQKIQRQWHLIDLTGETLGRAATKIAQLIVGKNKSDFSYHLDQGDYVVALNADKIVVTGRKSIQKRYYFHTAYAGHLKDFSLKEMMAKDPREVIYHAVLGMVPKNRLRQTRLTRLKIFVGDKHPYQDKFKS